jgi:phosphotransferase system IIB component
MKNLYVASEEMRTNPLSKIPGGSTIIVTYQNEYQVVYNNIKNIHAYINTIFERTDREITEIFVDGKSVYSKNKPSLSL